MTVCPACSNKVIMPVQKGSVLWLASRPSDEEYDYGRILSGETGDLVRKEFFLTAKVDTQTFSRASLWLHPIVKGKGGEGCFEVGLNTVLDFAKDKRIIILVGSEAVKHFTSLNVSECNGLDVTSECFLFPNAERVFAMTNPAVAFTKGIGEVRFAINNMKEYLK